MRSIARVFLGIIFAAYATLALALPFTPIATAPAFTCTSPSSRQALGVTSTAQQQLELQNTGTATVFFAWGDVTVTAAATSYPVPLGQSKLVTVGAGVTHVACFASSGSHTTYATLGAGDS